MMPIQLGSKEYLEHILGMKKKGAGRETKLPAVLLYLHTMSLDGTVSRMALGPFFENPARYEFLFALDGKEKSKIPFNGSCVKVRYESDVLDRRQGGKIERVELVQDNIHAALQVAARSLLLSWEDMLALLECTEEDIQEIQKRKSSGNTEREKSSDAVVKVGRFEPDLYKPARNKVASTATIGRRVRIQYVQHIPFEQDADASAKWRNLTKLLAELCRIAENDIVTVTQLAKQKQRLRNYLVDLSDRGCIQLVTEQGSRGRSGLSKIRIVKREVPKPALPKQKAHVNGPKPTYPGRLQIPEGFQLVKIEALRELKEKATKKDERSIKPATFVFVDVGNLTGKKEHVDGDGRECGRRILNIDNLNWRALREMIQREPRARERIEEMFAYVWTGILSDEIKFNAKHAGFTIVSHPKKDTDVAMSGDVGFFIRGAMEKYSTVHVILVTGDGDYNRVLHHLKNAARETNTTFTITFIACAGSLNQHSHNMADSALFVNLKELMVFQRQQRRVGEYQGRYKGAIRV